MSENAKKIMLVCVIALALVIAGLSAKKAFSGDEIIWHGSREVPPGTKSMKELEMEKQNADLTRKGVGTAPTSSPEKDLAGPISP